MAAGETVLDTLVTRLGYRRTGDRDLKAYEQSLDRVKQRMDAFSRHARTIGLVGVAALTKIGRTAYAFDNEMNSLQAATGYTADQMERLNALARKLGRETPFSASQAAAAMKLLGQAGLELDEIIAAIPHTLQMAAAGGLGIAEAADIAAGTMRGFGLAAGDVERIADVFAKVSTMAKTTVRDMGQAMPNSAALARTLGVSLEQVAAMAAVLQDANVQAAESGIGVRNIMSMLISLSGPAKEAIRRLNIDPQDIMDLAKAGRAVDALEMLQSAGFGAAEAADIFGRRVMTHALIIAQNLPKYRQLVEANRQAAGSSKRMMDTMLQGLPGAVRILVSVYESFELTLAQSGVRDALISTMEAARDALTWFEGLGSGTHRLAGIVISLLPLLILLSGAVRVLSWMLLPAVRAIGAMTAGFAALSAFIAAGKLPAALAGIVMAIRAFSLALVATPIGRVITAVALLAAGVVALRSTIRSIMSPFREWMAANPKLASGLWTLANAFGIVVAGLAAFRLAMWAASATMLTTPFGWLLTTIAAVSAALVYLVANWGAVESAMSSAAGWVGRNLFGWLGFGGEPGLVSTGVPTAPAAAALSGDARTAIETARLGGLATASGGGNVTVGSINVTVPGGDSQEIARNVGAALTDQMQNVIDDVDGVIEK